MSEEVKRRRIQLWHISCEQGRWWVLEMGVSSQQVRHSTVFSGLGLGFSGSRIEPNRVLTTLRGRSGDLMEGDRSPLELPKVGGRSELLLDGRFILLGLSSLRRCSDCLEDERSLPFSLALIDATRSTFAAL